MSDSPRPATVLRRRSLLFGLLLAATAGLSLAAVHGSERAVPFSAQGPRASALRAIKVLRPERPAAARLLDRLVANAEVVTAYEATASAWRRTPGRAETSWLRVHLAAVEALRELRQRTASGKARWQELAGSTTTQVAQARLEAQEAGIGRGDIASARRAEAQLDVARRFAAAGRFDRANAAAEVSLKFAQTVHRSWAGLHARFAEAGNLRLWRSWVDATITRSRNEGLTAFVIDKLRRRLFIYVGGQRIATYEIEIGAKGLHQKFHAGDQATPEGRYRIVDLKSRGRTKYYKALLIDYPNGEDRARYLHARNLGQVPLRAGPGSLIEIHGGGGQGEDWTDGCVALSDNDMDKVFARARVGTPVTIVGTF